MVIDVTVLTAPGAAPEAVPPVLPPAPPPQAERLKATLRTAAARAAFGPNFIVGSYIFRGGIGEVKWW
jgi:hypothetical protein